jgi:DNA-binding transcriptional LysR family regulator
VGTVSTMTYDLTDLQLFLQVVDQGSITRGADRSHLSLASASARIKAMEKALGAPLLIRHRRGVVPSPAGWLLVAHAREVVGQIARMRSELSRYSDGLRPTLVISANTSATETLVSSVIVDFMADNPDIDLELEERPSHEIVAAVTDGRAELGIIADTVDSGRLERAVLRPDPLVVITRPGHALAARAHVAFSECLGHPFVGFTEGNPLQEHLSGQTQPLGLRPRYRAHLPTTEAICSAVAVGVGIAVVPARAVVRWQRTYDLRVVDLTNSWAKRNLLLCSQRWSGLSEAAAALAARLKAHGAPAATPDDGGAEGA